MLFQMEAARFFSGDMFYWTKCPMGKILDKLSGKKMSFFKDTNNRYENPVGTSVPQRQPSGFWGKVLDKCVYRLKTVVAKTANFLLKTYFNCFHNTYWLQKQKSPFGVL